MSFTDSITDILAGLELFAVINIFMGSIDNSEMHVIWGSLTFMFMFLPGLMVIMQVLASFSRLEKKPSTHMAENSNENEWLPMLPSNNISILIDSTETLRVERRVTRRKDKE